MGLSIGQIPTTLAGSNRVDLFSRNGAGARGNDDDSGDLFFPRAERARPQAGFGRGTVSGPAAALETIDRGIEAARRTIPSFQQLRADQRERFEARRADAAERVSRTAERKGLLDRDREVVGRRIDFRVPDAAGRTREFINQVNEAASFALARVEGTEIPAGRGGASFVVNGETFAFGGPGPSFFGDTNTPTQFDVRA